MDGILLYGRKSCLRDITFKIYWVSKSIAAAKSQNFVNISGAQKHTWEKLLEFEFFLSEKTRLYIYYQNKNQLVVTSLSYINLKMKLFIKWYFLAQKQDKSEVLLFLGSSIPLLLQIDSLSFQVSYCFKEWCRLTKIKV